MYTQNTSYGGSQELTSTVDMDTVPQEGFRACSTFTPEDACHVPTINISPYNSPSPFCPSPQYCFTPINSDFLQVDPLHSNMSTSRNSLCDFELPYYTNFSNDGYITNNNQNLLRNSREFYNSNQESGYSSYCNSPSQINRPNRLSPEVPSVSEPFFAEQWSDCIINPQTSGNKQCKHNSHVTSPQLEQCKLKKNIKNDSEKKSSSLQTELGRSHSSGKKSTSIVFRFKTKQVVLRIR
ncbi:unnamed protein product [Meganyctiphanes norvegica]|uniref:Uncharacterized protein n=1 Tax=Meganyctiphanes norvegica TaxID=48144 RepID=A0AAV2RCP3_MEGNR